MTRQRGSERVWRGRRADAYAEDAGPSTKQRMSFWVETSSARSSGSEHRTNCLGGRRSRMMIRSGIRRGIRSDDMCNGLVISGN